MTDREIYELLTPVNKIALRRYAECGMKALPTARTLNYSGNAIFYNFRSIHAKTGLNPRDFWELYDLLKIIERESNGEDKTD